MLAFIGKMNINGKKTIKKYFTDAGEKKEESTKRAKTSYKGQKDTVMVLYAV